MLLSVSNIAWESSQDANMYSFIKEIGYQGLEIAPTRIFPQAPYNKLSEATEWSRQLQKNYGLCVPSMQSIWYGRQECLFGTETERQKLFRHTIKAIHFAASIGCKNLVFGCPKNRSLPDGVSPQTAIHFFRELGDYAYQHGTRIGMEANPAIYHTNYINDTPSALSLIQQVNSKGFLLNLDIGTMIQNEESIEILKGYGKYINHVHISEPHLKPIKKHDLHYQLRDFLQSEHYQNFVSIEMSTLKDISAIKEAMQYIHEIFGDYT